MIASHGRLQEQLRSFARQCMHLICNKVRSKLNICCHMPMQVTMAASSRQVKPACFSPTYRGIHACQQRITNRPGDNEGAD
jgi:hypothetical protein